MADEQVSITFRTAASKRDTLDEIAQNLQRDRSYVVNEAVDWYLADFEHEKRLVEEGIAAADRGELIDHDELFDELEREFEGKVEQAG